MEFRRLGRSGVRVSAVGLGCNQFGGKVAAEGVREILAAAADLGINFLDTADVYQQGRSEETIGAALAALGSRDRWVVATKVGLKTGDGPNERGASRWRIRRQVEASLRRLRTDRIDLYQIHEWDPDTPIEETLAALEDLVRAGKIRYAGASNFAGWQLARADAIADLRGWTPFITVQLHYHMFERDVEKELLPLCEARGIGALPYFPLAGGFLTGKYRPGAPPPPGSRGEASSYVQKYFTPANFDRLARLEAWARKRDRSIGELAIAWLLARRCVPSVICGATNAAQVRENARAASWTLSPEDLREVEG